MESYQFDEIKKMHLQNMQMMNTIKNSIDELHKTIKVIHCVENDK